MSSFLSPLAAFALLAAPTCFAASITVPYFENFDSIAGAGSSGAVATATKITQSATGYLNVVNASTNPAMRAQIMSGNSASGSLNTGITGPNDFTISTQLLANNLTAGTATNMNYALVAAGATNLTNTYRLNIDFLAGTIGLSKAGTAQTGATVSGTAPSLALNNALSVSLSGTYLSATSVLVTGVVSDATNTYTLSFTDSSGIYTGEYYGFTSAKTTSTTSTFSVYMDNFSINVVPEPSSALLAAAGLSAFLSRRVRRSAWV